MVRLMHILQGWCTGWVGQGGRVEALQLHSIGCGIAKPAAGTNGRVGLVDLQSLA